MTASTNLGTCKESGQWACCAASSCNRRLNSSEHSELTSLPAFGAEILGRVRTATKQHSQAAGMRGHARPSAVLGYRLLRLNWHCGRERHLWQWKRRQEEPKLGGPVPAQDAQAAVHPLGNSSQLGYQPKCTSQPRPVRPLSWHRFPGHWLAWHQEERAGLIHVTESRGEANTSRHRHHHNINL